MPENHHKNVLGHVTKIFLHDEPLMQCFLLALRGRESGNSMNTWLCSCTVVVVSWR